MCSTQSRIASASQTPFLRKHSIPSLLRGTLTITNKSSKKDLLPRKWPEPHTKIPICSMSMTAKPLKPSKNPHLKRATVCVLPQHTSHPSSKTFRRTIALQTPSTLRLSTLLINNQLSEHRSLVENRKELKFCLGNKIWLLWKAHKIYRLANQTPNVFTKNLSHPNYKSTRSSMENLPKNMSKIWHKQKSLS